MPQQKQIFGFRKSKLTKNLTGAVLGAALLASVGVAQADTPTEGRQPDRITEKTKVTFSVNDWSNNQLPTKYDPIGVDKVEPATSVIQVGTSGTEVLPKNSYIKITQEATGVEFLLANTDVQVQRTSSPVNVTPRETSGTTSKSVTTIDISGMPAGTVQSYTAAFNSMGGFYPVSTLTRTYELYVDGQKVDTKTFKNTFKEVKPTVTATASESHTKFEGGRLAGELGTEEAGMHVLSVTKNVSRPVTLQIRVPDGVVPVGFKEASDRPIQKGLPNGATFEAGVLTLPRYYGNQYEIPIFSPTPEVLKKPLATDPKNPNTKPSKNVTFHVTMTVPTDPENNNYTTVETDANTREFTSDTSIVFGQLTIRDTRSPYSTEQQPTSASDFTTIIHGSVQEYATKGSTVMDVHPVLMQLDPTNVIDPSGLTMTFSMYSDESEEPLHFEIRNADTNQVLVADYTAGVHQIGRTVSEEKTIDIPYTKNLLVVPKAKAGGTLPQIYEDGTKGTTKIHYRTDVKGLNPQTYRDKVVANAGKPLKIDTSSQLMDTKVLTKTLLAQSNSMFVAYVPQQVSSTSAQDTVYIGQNAQPSSILVPDPSNPGRYKQPVKGWAMTQYAQMDNRSNGQSSDTLVKALEKIPSEQQPKVHYTLPEGIHLISKSRELIDGSTTSVMQLMSGIGLMAEEGLPTGTYEVPYELDLSTLPNGSDYTIVGADKDSKVLRGTLKLTLYNHDKISTSSEIKVGSTWRPYKLDVQKDAPFTIRSNVRIGQKVASQLNTLVYIPKKGRDKTTIDTFLTGPVGYGDDNGTIPKDSRWAIEYTTDPITGDRVADNKKLHFTKTVDDYSKVTAVRFVLEAPMQFASGFDLQKLNFPLVTHDEITPTSVAYYRTSLVDSEHSYDSDFVALAGPNFVDHDKVLANSKGSVRQLFKEEGTNKELAPQTDTGMKPVGEALSLTHPKTIQFEGKTYEFTRQDKVDPTKIPDAFRETITYFYKEVQPKGNVVQKFVDEAGKEIKASTDTGVKPVDEAIKLEHPTTIHFEDNDYTFMKQDKVDPTKIVEGTQTITYIYKKVEKPVVKGNVVQKFVDETGKEIKASTDTGVKLVDEAIKLEHPTTIHFEDNDYAFVRQDKVDPTKIVEGTQTVTYIYRKVEKPVVKGNVVQKFVDEAGKEIKASTDTGVKPVDEAIKLEHPTTIHFEDNDYTFVRQDKVDPTKIIEGTQTITYIYKKVEKPVVKPVVKGNVVQKFVDEAGKEIKASTDTGVKLVDEAIKLEHPTTIHFEDNDYTFVKQDKVDPTKIVEGTQTITYIYKKVEKPVVKGNVVQKFVDEAGKEIKASTDTGVKPVDEAIKLEHPTTIHFEDNDYTFVKQDKVDPTKIVEGTQIVTYIYRKVEKPVVKGNVVQKFVDEAGKEIKASTDTGVKPVDEAIKLEHPTTIHFEDNDYTFVKQDKVDPTKIVEGTQTITYIYRKVEKPVKKVTTIWVTEKGEVLKPRTDGEQPKENFDGYEFVRTDKDKDGNTTHIYRPIEKPVKKVTTIWVTEKGEVLKPRTDGEQPKENFDGYEFVRTDKDKDGNTTHIYKPVKKVTTIWVTEKGDVLKPRTDGEQPKENFDGYEFVRTDKDKDGNTTHIYRPIEKPVKKVTTIWVTEKGDVLKPRTDGEQPKENFDGYEFVRTDKDKDGNTTHIYRPIEKPVKKVTTIWVTEKGEVLKPRTDGEQPKENFDGYEFVRTDKDKDGNTTHIYRPIEKPVKKVTTIWVTEKGDVLKPKTEGELPKENFDGYEFVRTDKDKDGNTTHVYHKVEKPVEKPVKKVTTIWVTEKGEVLKPRTDGEQPKENFDGYEFVRTDKDQDGNTTHIYRKVEKPVEKPVKKVTTIWVTEKGEVLKPRTDGEQPKENFDGYEFVRTDKDQDGNTAHVYRKVEKPAEKPVEKPVKKVYTSWVTETGEVLKPRTEGEQPKENFDGYEFVRTDKDKDGNISHIYKKVESKPVEKPQVTPQPQKVETPKELPKVETPKELPKTGDASTSLGFVSIALMAAGILARPRKRRDE